MTYTILSARYANEEHLAAEVMTEEAGAVILSAADTPDDWDALLGGDVEIAAYEPPPPAFLALSPRQLRLMMLQLGMDEADIEAEILTIEDDAERAAAMIEWKWATCYERDHPLVVQLAGALEFDPEQLDALWIYAADL